MYTGIKHLHSFLPYILLLLLGVGFLVFLIKRFRGGDFTSGNRQLALFTLIAAHTQLVVGLILYAISPVIKAAYASGELMSDATQRFYAIEHLGAMVIAVVLITIGYSKSKRQKEDAGKFRVLSLFYGLALILILARIPWDIWPAI